MIDVAATTNAGEAERWVDRDWLAVAAAMLGQILSLSPLTIYTFGVFIRPLHAEFGWSRTELAVAISLSQFTIGLSSPFWGMASDRFGPRVLLLPAVVGLGVLVASLDLLTPHLWHLYLVFLVISIVGPSPVLYSAVLARLFNRRLGLTLGLAVMGIGIGSALMPPFAQHLIGSLGWRHAYLALGVTSIVISLPAALVATRHVHGPTSHRRDASVVAVLPSVRTRPFVLIAAVFVLLGVASIGTLTQFVPMMIDRGFSPGAAARLAALIGIAALVSRGGTGWLLDQVQGPRVLAAVSLLLVVAFLLLGLRIGGAALYLVPVLLGLAIGAETDFVAFLTRRYFPQELFGRLFGLLFLAFTVGGGTGPILMGLSFDRLGGYSPALMLFAVLGIITMFLALGVPKYRVPQPV